MQTWMMVECLEKQAEGLNLAWDVLDGIKLNSCSGDPYTLEGEYVRLYDTIVYINHNLDDAIRGGILTEEDIPAVFRKALGSSCKERLNTMVHDVITNSMDRPEIRMSEGVEAGMTGLRKFMFENVYLNPKAKGEEDKAVHMIEQLYEYYVRHTELLPKQYLDALTNPDNSREQIVCDYIAGMTDPYAVKKFQEFFVPESWKI